MFRFSKKVSTEGPLCLILTRHWDRTVNKTDQNIHPHRVYRNGGKLNIINN